MAPSEDFLNLRSLSEFVFFIKNHSFSSSRTLPAPLSFISIQHNINNHSNFQTFTIATTRTMNSTLFVDFTIIRFHAFVLRIFLNTSFEKAFATFTSKHSIVMPSSTVPTNRTLGVVFVFNGLVSCQNCVVNRRF